MPDDEPLSTYVLTPHAIFDMARRGIDENVIQRVMEQPEQRLPVRPGRDVGLKPGDGSSDSCCGGRGSVTGGGCDSLSDKQNGEILEEETMKMTYDQKTDTLTVMLRSDVQVVESDEDKPGRDPGL